MRLELIFSWCYVVCFAKAIASQAPSFISIDLSKSNAERVVLRTTKVETVKVYFDSPNATARLWVTSSFDIWDTCDEVSGVLIDANSPAQIPLPSTKKLYIYASGASPDGKNYCDDLNWKAMVVAAGSLSTIEIGLFSGFGFLCTFIITIIGYRMWGRQRGVVSRALSSDLRDQKISVSLVADPGFQSKIVEGEPSATVVASQVASDTEIAASRVASDAEIKSEGISVPPLAPDPRKCRQISELHKQGLGSQSNPGEDMGSKPTTPAYQMEGTATIISKTVHSSGLKVVQPDSERKPVLTTRKLKEMKRGSVIFTLSDNDKYQYPRQHSPEFVVDPEQEVSSSVGGSISSLPTEVDSREKFANELRGGQYTPYKSKYLYSRLHQFTSSAPNLVQSPGDSVESASANASTRDVDTKRNSFDPTRMAEETAQIALGKDVTITESFIDLGDGDSVRLSTAGNAFFARDLLSSQSTLEHTSSQHVGDTSNSRKSRKALNSRDVRVLETNMRTFDDGNNKQSKHARGNSETQRDTVSSHQPSQSGDSQLTDCTLFSLDMRILRGEISEEDLVSDTHETSSDTSSDFQNTLKRDKSEHIQKALRIANNYTSFQMGKYSDTEPEV